jgi:hypothetical protein
MFYSRLALVFCLLLLLPVKGYAWDALGHRLTAYLAYDQMSTAEQAHWSTVLRAHPRFRQDFIDAMPADIARLSVAEQQRWQFGQAAIWPDIARGFQGFDQRRFHFPNRHWIDGTWVRDDVPLQGNIYLNMDPLPDQQGPQDQNITQQSEADNVLSGLVYARYALMTHNNPAERAIALSWLLHLIGDIHQPLHTGALFTPNLFPEGDRGGNLTRVDGSNLHAIWDQALRGRSLNRNLTELRAVAAQLERGFAFEPGQWMLESREILHAEVYPDNVIANIQRSDNTGNQLGSMQLRDTYREAMREQALQRIAEAGHRIYGTLLNLPR